MSFPPAPWQMHGQLWLSLFRSRTAVDELRPAGVYGVAFVDYQPGSVLTYHELLVARLVRGDKQRPVTITDIWVDSADSREGGRELWAIPKELCGFEMATSHRGPLARTSWSASVGDRSIARARFRDVSRAGVRLPFKGDTWQPREDGSDARAHLRGSAKSLPCLGSWDFEPDGPLGWLAGKRAIASFRMADFTMSFG